MPRLVLPALVVLLALFIYRSGHALKSSILFSPQLPEQFIAQPYSSCGTVQHEPDMSFCEDMAKWESGRALILSCDPGRKQWNTVMGPLNDPSPRGSLHVYSLETKTTSTLELVDFPHKHDFHPLGLDVHGDDLYVINHARQRTFIEHFVLLSNNKAKYARTLDSSVHFKSANSIAISGPDSFYVSNDHFFTRRIAKPLGNIIPLIETVFGLPFSWVSHVKVHPYKDPASFHDPIGSTLNVAKGLSFANGISLSKDGSALAVASSSINAVMFYHVDNQTHALTYDRTVHVPISADNVRFDDQDNLIVAGHSNFPALIQVAKGVSGVKAPSWVLEIKKGEQGWNTLYQSDGSVFGSSSTGVRDGDKLYIVGLYERGLLVCE